MNESLSEKHCPTCGAPLPAATPGGLCPKCLLLGAAEATETAVGGNPRRPEPPPLAEVAQAFPQLEIIGLIGQGGMGCVFKARQPQLNRVVALKILPASRATEPAFAERFAREARALAAMNHPNIVTIHDFGKSGGFFYLLMEFVDGLNLRQLLRERRLAPEEALAIVPPLCEALQFAHDRGIVHRDIKPENLLLDRTGRVKIADFGIAKMLEPGLHETPDLTSPDPQSPASAPSGSVVAGTPGYMAPEQRVSPQRVDSRADIYSLGAVLYEMLTGELPGTTLQPPSRKVLIDVRLDEIVLRALEKSPELRFQTAAELRTQLETLAAPPPPAQAPESSTVAPKGIRAVRYRKGEFLGVGAAIQALGLALFFVTSYGWIPGLVLLIIGGRMAFKLICSHCGNRTDRHARQCGSCGAVFESSPPSGLLIGNTPNPLSSVGWRRAWLEKPLGIQTRVVRMLYVAGLLATLLFVTPHHSVLGDGSTRVWTLGLPDAWLTDIARTSPAMEISPGMVQQTRHVNIHFDRFSFFCGLFALGTWGFLIALQRASHRHGLLNLIHPARAEGAPRIHWGRFLAGWIACCSLFSTLILLPAPWIQWMLHIPATPIPCLVGSVLLATLASIASLFHSATAQQQSAPRTFHPTPVSRQT